MGRRPRLRAAQHDGRSVPVTPLRRQVIVDAGAHYENRARWSGFRRGVTFEAETVPKHDGDPGSLGRASRHTFVAFLVWARFPFWVLEDTPDGTRVTVSDIALSDVEARSLRLVVVK